MEKQTLDQFSSPAFIVSTLFQGAFFGILVTHVIGVIRLILEIIYPVPQCGKTDTRPVFLSGIHSFTLFQGAFFGILVTHVIGVIRLILEIIYPVPRCGETDTRPVFLSGIHSFYFSQIMMAIQVVLVLGISLFTGPRSKGEVIIGKTPITQLRTCVIKSSIQGRSPNVVKVIFRTIRNCS